MLTTPIGKAEAASGRLTVKVDAFDVLAPFPGSWVTVIVAVPGDAKRFVGTLTIICVVPYDSTNNEMPPGAPTPVQVTVVLASPKNDPLINSQKNEAEPTGVPAVIAAPCAGAKSVPAKSD
jgi:hypothetical protein